MPKKDNTDTSNGSYDQTRFMLIALKYLVIITVIGVTLISFYVTVPAGSRGILMTFGKVEGTLSEGFHWKLPYQSVTLMNVRTSKYYVERMEGATKDLQDLYIELSVNYRISPDNAQDTFLRLGTEDTIKDTVIAPAVEQIVKANTVKYEAGEVLDNREILRTQIDEELKEQLSYYGIEVEYVNIENIDFRDEYREAIERKAVAVQNLLAEERELEIRKIKAEQVRVQAQGEADANYIQIEAQAKGIERTAEAKAKELELQKAYTTPELVQLKWIEKWNGVIPPFSDTQGMTPIIQIGDTDIIPFSTGD